MQDAARQKRWCVTEALVKEHGRPVGCPRCSVGVGIHNAECRRRIEGILLRQSRVKAKEGEESQGARTLTKAVPMGPEMPAGPVVKHGGSSGSWCQIDTGPRSVATPFIAEALPESRDRRDGCW